jgi:cell wall-associated NlpC family hydrolase
VNLSTKNNNVKSLSYFVLVLLFFSSCKSVSTIQTTTSRNNVALNSKLAENIVASAIENLGVGYKTAGTTKAGYDCSGLVFSTFALYDISLPRTSVAQSKIGVNLGQRIDKAQKGDLIFFKTNGSTQINHVGIITEVNDDELLFIHTSTSKGVILSSTKEPYYQKTFVQLNHLIL